MLFSALLYASLPQLPLIVTKPSLFVTNPFLFIHQSLVTPVPVGFEICSTVDKHAWLAALAGSPVLENRAHA